MCVLRKLSVVNFLLLNVLLYINASESPKSSPLRSNQSQISDYTENELQCGNTEQCTNKSSRYTRATNATTRSNEFCPAHSPSEDKNIEYEFHEGKNFQQYRRNGLFPTFTVARMQCKPNYSPLEGAYFRSICHENTWIPEIDDCFKKCDKLNPINVDIECYRRGKNIPCDKILLAGTRVRPKCKKLHTYRDFIPTYRELVCQYDGKWNNMLFSCVPECGKSYQTATTLISDGNDTRAGDSPWHVAIYNQNKILICGGTIIHSYLIISAAHCFHSTNSTRESTNNFDVVVSKFSREYKKFDNMNQKIYQIREIRFPTKGYAGMNNYFAADIAILILKEKIAISPTVLPACVDWAGLNTNEYPPDDTPGKVSGWGLNKNGKVAETLKTANLPIITRDSCLKTVPDDFKAYVTYDKFCAGSENGPGVLQGDSGGGYLLQQNGLYFLRGIVSLKQPTITSIAAFTDLADHIDWILATRNEIEQEILDRERRITVILHATEKICQRYSGQLCTPFSTCAVGRDWVLGRKAVHCGNDSKGAPRLCCPSNQIFTTSTWSPNKPIPPTNPPFFPSTTAPTSPPLPPTTPDPDELSTGGVPVAAFDTLDSITTLDPLPILDPFLNEPVNESENGNDNEGSGILIPNEPLTTCYKYSMEVEKDCVNPKIPYKGVTKALPREYPHMAVIGYGKNFKDVEWLCDGSLISEKFILSAARCKQTALGEPKWIMLGDLNITSTTDDARSAVYSISKSHYSSADSIYENLALYELNTTVVMSPYIRPACLHSSPSQPIPVGTKGVISGWGWDPTSTNDRSNEYLLKAALTVVDNGRCERFYNANNATKLDEKLANGFQSETMICAGDLTEGEVSCADIDGSPLQIRMEGQFCTWQIFAVSSFGPTSCRNVAEYTISNPRIYVNVTYHLPWIKEVVGFN